jgi:hypothetical protein
VGNYGSSGFFLFFICRQADAVERMITAQLAGNVQMAGAFAVATPAATAIEKEASAAASSDSEWEAVKMEAKLEADIAMAKAEGGSYSAGSADTSRLCMLSDAFCTRLFLTDFFTQLRDILARGTSISDGQGRICGTAGNLTSVH